MNILRGTTETWNRGRDQALRAAGVNDPAAKKNFARRLGEGVKSTAMALPPQLVLTTATTLYLWMNSGWSAFAGSMGSCRDRTL